MARQMIYNPADGNYVYVDDPTDPNLTPTSSAPPLDAIGRALGVNTTMTPAPTDATGGYNPGGPNGGGQMSAMPVGTPQFVGNAGGAPTSSSGGGGGGGSPTGSGSTSDPNASLSNSGDYDPVYEAAIGNYANQENIANQRYANSLNALQSAFVPQAGQLDQQHADALDRLQSQLAEQGILRSSNNLYAQGMTNSNYQNQADTLAQQRQQQSTDLANQRLEALSNIGQGRNQALTAHAAYLAQQAQQRAQLQAMTQAYQQGMSGLQDTLRGLMVQNRDTLNAGNPVVPQVAGPNVTSIYDPGGNYAATGGTVGIIPGSNINATAQAAGAGTEQPQQSYQLPPVQTTPTGQIAPMGGETPTFTQPDQQMQAQPVGSAQLTPADAGLDPNAILRLLAMSGIDPNSVGL